MAIVIGPIRLEHPRLGGLLAPQITVDVVCMLEKAGEGVDGQGLFRRLLETFARKVSPEGRSTFEELKAGEPLTAKEVASLSPDEIEDLAGQYLASPACWQADKGDETGGNADRLLVVVRKAMEKHGEASAKARKAFESLAVSDDLKRMLSRTSEMSRSLSDVLGPSHSIQEALRKAVFRHDVPDALKAALEPSSGLKAAMDAMQNPGIKAAMDAARNVHNAIPLSVRKIMEQEAAFDPSITGSARQLLGGTAFPRTQEDLLPRLQRIELPRNPIFDTNEILGRVSDDIDRMVEISNRQADLIQSLAETANLALGEAASSSADAKRSAELAKEATTFTKWSVVVAVIAIFLSGAVSAVAIWDARRIADGNDVMTKELIEAVREGARVTQGMQVEIREQAKESLGVQTKELLDARAESARAIEAVLERLKPSQSSR